MPFVEINHIHLRYEIYGRGRPVLFLHGLGSSADDWALQIPVFAERYRVIAPDLRAHGQSESNGRFSIETMADDVGELLARLDATPAHVVGLSLGGCAALALALRQPARVRSLVVVNSFARYRPGGWAGIRRSLRRAWLLSFRPMPELAAFVAGGLFPKPEQRPLYEAAVARLSQNPRRTYWHSLRAIGSFDLEKQVSAIRCPTLIIAGDRDATVPLVCAQRLHRAIPGSRLRVIPDSGHGTPYDQYEVFNREVMEFIERMRDEG
jgi:pimeloyl-ACP methyl ester carboxylesterase